MHGVRVTCSRQPAVLQATQLDLSEDIVLAVGRATGASQPTLGRHIRMLEDSLSVTLFHRVPRGLDLTEAGARLVQPATAMAVAAARLARITDGQADTVKGTVRLTASTVVSHHLLPPIIARLRQTEPLIQIELVPSDTIGNLMFREADIALRMYRPEQLDIITRKVADIPIGLYAAKSYLDRVGRPAGLTDALKMDFVGFDRSDLILRVLRGMGIEVSREFFAVRCDAQPVFWELVRAGCGIGASPCRIAEADPLVGWLLPDLSLPDLPLWLAAPQELRSNPRIRLV